MEDLAQESCHLPVSFGGDSEDISGREAYRLGRVHRLYSQILQGQEVAGRAAAAVLVKARENLNMYLEI